MFFGFHLGTFSTKLKLLLECKVEGLVSCRTRLFLFKLSFYTIAQKNSCCQHALVTVVFYGAMKGSQFPFQCLFKSSWLPKVSKMGVRPEGNPRRPYFSAWWHQQTPKAWGYCAGIRWQSKKQKLLFVLCLGPHACQSCDFCLAGLKMLWVTWVGNMVHPKWWPSSPRCFLLPLSSGR